jgi:hypothetical protein
MRRKTVTFSLVCGSTTFNDPLSLAQNGLARYHFDGIKNDYLASLVSARSGSAVSNSAAAR